MTAGPSYHTTMTAGLFYLTAAITAPVARVSSDSADTCTEINIGH